MNFRADEILEADHADLDCLLAGVQTSLADDDINRTYKMLDLYWARLAMHIRAEHLHLFPALLNASKSDAEVDALIMPLRGDHDFFMTELGSLLKVFRASSNNEAAETMKGVRAKLANITKRLEEHNNVEESRLYPLVSELGETEANRLALGIIKELNNLPSRFRVA